MRTTLKYNISASTNKGTKSINEDAYFVGTNKAGQYLAIVCDGIGSQDDSQIASLITVNVFSNSFNKHRCIRNVHYWFEKCLHKAHSEITLRSEKYLHGKKIGTTLLVCLISDKRVNVFNLGDTRFYHYSFVEANWNQITTDHNLYNHLLNLYKKDNTIKINELLVKYKSQLLSLTKCIESGSNAHQGFGSYSFDIESGDVLFLSSDGVYNYIKLEDVTNTIRNLSNNVFEYISDNLIRKALDNNSNDNLTSIVIECLTKNV